MRTQCIINNLKFNDGSELKVSPNDIVVFVGANNCGKTQSLKDIEQGVVNSEQTVVVKEVKYSVNNLQTLEDELRSVSSFDKQNNHYSGYGYNLYAGTLNQISEHSFGYSGGSKYFIKRLETKDRLGLCNPVGVIDRDEPKSHPIHYIVNDKKLRDKIDKSFHLAFGKHLQLERFGGRTNFLRIGNAIPRLTIAGCSLDADIDHANAIMNTYPKLHEQGDGMVSFTGILLSLLIPNFSIHLLDEPEAFLHPPQARILGTVIPELIEGKQAFVSTHSEHLINGLLESAPERIKVVRISRNANNNTFSIIDTEKISEIWKDTLLRQSNVFQGLFYDSVVICESDSDCQFYSSIHSCIKEKNGMRERPFYVYSSTKSRMKVIVNALKPLNVSIRVVADLDLLREKADAQSLYEACGGVWADIDEDFSLLTNSLKDDKNTISKEDLKQLFLSLLDSIDKDEYDRKALKDLKSQLSLEYKWKALKENGIIALPDDAKEPFKKIHDAFTLNNIYLVPRGQLEGFVPIVKGHGPRWVASVFEKYPDFNDGVYADAISFIESWQV